MTAIKTEEGHEISVFNTGQVKPVGLDVADSSINSASGSRWRTNNLTLDEAKQVRDALTEVIEALTPTAAVEAASPPPPAESEEQDNIADLGDAVLSLMTAALAARANGYFADKLGVALDRVLARIL